MTTLFIIIGGIVLTGILAFLIVNKIPRKFHWIISVVLLALAAFLVYKINFEIQKPISFNKVKKVKYSKVIEQLKIIRDAEVAHKKVTGSYTVSGEDLIKFIDTAQFAVTQTYNKPETIRLSGGLTTEIEIKVTDTIGFVPVRESFKGKKYKQMMNIPGTDQKFKIEIGEIQKVAGIKVPVFEVKVDKALILKGMDYNLIKQEKEAIGGDEISGAFIIVGSLGEVSEDGNWPPYYDKLELLNEQKDKENTK